MEKELIEGKIQSRTLKDKKLHLLIEVPESFKPVEDVVYFAVDPQIKTHRQLNFFHAICTDIGSHLGESQEGVKSIFKANLGVETLVDASRRQMANLIEFAIEFCKEQEIPLSEKTVHQMDADKRIDICTHFKSCLICGKPADTHHIDVIGMGRERDKVDKMYPKLKKVPLCRSHHTEVEQVGVDKFIERYHLKDFKEYFKRNQFYKE